MIASGRSRVQRGRKDGRRKVAFVLSGGGLYGAVQVGCLEALLRHGITPDLVVGTSVGALNGAWLAMYPDLEGVERLKEIWLGIKRSSLFPGRRFGLLLHILLGRDHLYDSRGLRELVARHAGGMTFEQLRLPLYVTATDLETGDLVVFHRGPLAPAILASTAIPGVFPPVEIEGRLCVDGAVLSNCNVETAWQHGATEVFILECPHPPPGKVFGALGPLFRAIWASLNRLCRLEIERFQDRLRVHFLQPQIEEAIRDRGDFSRVGDLIEEGRRWTEGYLQSGLMPEAVP